MPLDYTQINGVPKRGELVIGHINKAFKHVPDNIRPKTKFTDKILKKDADNFKDYLIKITANKEAS